MSAAAAPPSPKPRSRSRVGCTPARMYLHYELCSGLYMLDASEKIAFNVALVVLLAVIGRFLVVPALPLLPHLARGAAAAARQLLPIPAV